MLTLGLQITVPSLCYSRILCVHVCDFLLLNLYSFGCQVGGLEVQNPHTQNFQPAVPIVCLDSEARF